MVSFHSLTPFQIDLLQVVVIGVTIPLAAVVVLCLLLTWVFSLGNGQRPRR